MPGNVNPLELVHLSGCIASMARQASTIIENRVNVLLELDEEARLFLSVEGRRAFSLSQKIKAIFADGLPTDMQEDGSLWMWDACLALAEGQRMGRLESVAIGLVRDFNSNEPALISAHKILDGICQMLQGWTEGVL